MIGLLIALLTLLNLGGLMALVLQLGQGEWAGALGSLAFLVVFDALGVWLLRGLREHGK